MADTTTRTVGSVPSSDDREVRTVLILIAMEQEAQMFIDAFGLKEEKAKKPPLSNIPSRQFHRFYTPSPGVGEGGGDGQGVHVYVVTNGRDERFDCNNVGTTPAAISTFAAVSQLNPDVVINAGTAGGFHRVGGAIGDVYLCNYFTHHDRRIPLSEQETRELEAKRAGGVEASTVSVATSAMPPAPPAPTMLPDGCLTPHNTYMKGSVSGADRTDAPMSSSSGTGGGASGSGPQGSGVASTIVYHDYGYGKHQQLHLTGLVESLQCKRGNVSTSNSLDHTERDDEFMLVNGAHVKDMEAAAIAWVIENCCGERPIIPFFAIKVVTDIVDGHTPTQEEFLSNLSTASQTLCATLTKTVCFIAEKRRLSEL